MLTRDRVIALLIIGSWSLLALYVCMLIHTSIDSGSDWAHVEDVLDTYCICKIIHRDLT